MDVQYLDADRRPSHALLWGTYHSRGGGRYAVDGGRLETGRGENGGKCLLVRQLGVPPDRGVLCELYQPTIVRAQEDFMIIRGVEKVFDPNGKAAAVIQEWQLKLRPQANGVGQLPPGVDAPSLRLTRHE